MLPRNFEMYNKAARMAGTFFDAIANCEDPSDLEYLEKEHAYWENELQQQCDALVKRCLDADRIQIQGELK